jgi:hypothetical protein
MNFTPIKSSWEEDGSRALITISNIDSFKSLIRALYAFNVDLVSLVNCFINVFFFLV